MPDRDRKHVITAFLWDGRHVLLALRSGRVSTFPNHWAGISGYVEQEQPLERAFIEIAEETGLARRHVVLRRAGDPISVDAAAGGFVVHPFLFSVPQGAGVRSDWEAAHFEWVGADELLAGRRSPTVPRLSDALRAVWPAWDYHKALDANLEGSQRWLRDDRSMGASTLARAASDELAKLIPLCDEAAWPEERDRLADAARRLASTRPTMAPLQNLLEDLADALRQARTPHEAARRAERLIDQSRDAASAAALNAADAIAHGERVITISYSGTVRDALLAAKEKLREALVCEGRPLCEGRRLARELAEAGVDVAILTDAQAFAAMQGVDRVLIGADAVTAEGGVVNKAGSALLAVAAQRAGVRVTVVCESLKRLRTADARLPTEANPPEEVWSDAPPGVRVLNEYFELVPADLVDEVITEADGR